MIKNLFIVGIGGFIGTVLRFTIYHLLKNGQPYINTFFINIIGSLAIGLIIGISIKDVNFSNQWKPFLATGICGGFTTFSAFSMENLKLIQEGKYWIFLFYVLGSVLLGTLAAFIGFRITV